MKELMGCTGKKCITKTGRLYHCENLLKIVGNEVGNVWNLGTRSRIGHK